MAFYVVNIHNLHIVLQLCKIIIFLYYCVVCSLHCLLYIYMLMLSFIRKINIFAVNVSSLTKASLFSLYIT